jgi:hypothetical protein
MPDEPLMPGATFTQTANGIQRAYRVATTNAPSATGWTQ